MKFDIFEILALQLGLEASLKPLEASLMIPDWSLIDPWSIPDWFLIDLLLVSLLGLEFWTCAFVEGKQRNTQQNKNNKKTHYNTNTNKEHNKNNTNKHNNKHDTKNTGKHNKHNDNNKKHKKKKDRNKKKTKVR